MCIISQEVHSVCDTHILVISFPETQRQVTVYENTIHNAALKKNAMILPVPHPRQSDLPRLVREEKLFPKLKSLL
jgi:hypothetical protein